MDRPTPPDLGERAADFDARASDGTMHGLAELCADRPLVLVFYRGHW